MPLLSIENYSEPMERSAQRTLDTLDKLDARMSQHYSATRAHHRKKFRGQVTILLPGDGESETESEICKVWARSISSSGMSFIYPEKLEAQQIIVGLSLSESDPIWFNAEIVRAKEFTEEQFWEYGVRFLQRAQR